MIRICTLLFAITMLSVFSGRAQNTEGKEFWLTFGSNWGYVLSDLNFYIRIVSGDNLTTATISFTNLGTSHSFSIPAQQVFTYSLTATEKQAVFNTTTGVSNRTISISTNNPVNVYIMNQGWGTTDATHILPVTDLGVDYYHISNSPSATHPFRDTYAAIAVENDTRLFHNGNLETTLNVGQVYYRTSYTDMTGSHITADKIVAFFAICEGARIPQNYHYSDCLMQQMIPVNTWGTNFFVPVSHLTRDFVRIVASQNNTNITQTGGTLRYPAGAQTSLTNLQAGQFVELEVTLSNNGCYIQADKPVGVCTFLTSMDYNSFNVSDPAQCWLPPIEYTVNETLISPFVPTGSNTELNAHYALIVTQSTTKNNTQVSINGASPVDLSGGIWRDHTVAGMSFYNMPLTNEMASYRFTNDVGLTVLSYGTGLYESYYYLAGSVIRNVADATFYANNIHYQDLPPHLFCINDIVFRAAIDGLDSNSGSLKWYINNTEEVSARDQLLWNKNFSAGEYEIEMWVRFSNNDTTSIKSILNIGAVISTSSSPPEGGSTTGGGCFKVGDGVNLIATPNTNYFFTNWTEDSILASSNSAYTFTATKDRVLTANFALNPLDTLDFDNYAIIICNRVILLNLKKLSEDGFDVTDCKWFKNGILQKETHTMNAFSYAEGPVQLLDTIPTFYTYCLLTKNHGEVCSTQKIIINYDKIPGCSQAGAPENPVLVYPNPVSYGSELTLEGLVAATPVYLYNHLGICVFSTITTDNVMTLSINFPQGIYLVRNENKIVKVLVVK